MVIVYPGVQHGAAPIAERCSVTLACGLGLVMCVAVPVNVVEVRVWTCFRGIARVHGERAANRVDQAVVINVTCILIARRPSCTDLERKVFDQVEGTCPGSLARAHEVQRGLFHRDGPLTGSLVDGHVNAASGGSFVSLFLYFKLFKRAS